MRSFSSRLVSWQRRYGRHDLPWQGADAYRVWLSEIMLQQTQVITVIPYFQRFVASFPTLAVLAAASEEQVLTHWSGLGYYARGRNLHRAAQIIVGTYGGEFPRKFEQILMLPGIGRSTAAAICALAHHERRAILDGNVKRLIARYAGIAGWTGDGEVEKKLWQIAEELLPRHEIARYIQAQMDLGAKLCTRSSPKCGECPVSADCVAFQSGRVSELPSPRPRKVMPERQSTFLLLMSGRDILLEKRAPKGIWGGMWCPPELFDGLVDESDYVHRCGIDISERITLARFNHSFTHFKMNIIPVLLRVKNKPDLALQNGCMWIDMEQALHGAIPTPVRKMLKSIYSSGE